MEFPHLYNLQTSDEMDATVSVPDITANPSSFDGVASPNKARKSVGANTPRESCELHDTDAQPMVHKLPAAVKNSSFNGLVLGDYLIQKGIGVGAFGKVDAALTFYFFISLTLFLSYVHLDDFFFHFFLFFTFL
jgi:hypothetical protein